MASRTFPPIGLIIHFLNRFQERFSFLPYLDSCFYNSHMGQIFFSRFFPSWPGAQLAQNSVCSASNTASASTPNFCFPPLPKKLFVTFQRLQALVPRNEVQRRTEERS